jgi:GNAT acetyltransferase-like protein
VVEVDQLQAAEEPDWDAFLRRRPGGLFVHSIAYRNLLASELGCEPEYLVARDAGEVRGVLPLMWSADGGGRVCNSLPFHGSHGGPVAADALATSALIAAWEERASDPGTLASTMIENPFLERRAPEPLHELTDERFTQFTVLPAGGGEQEVTALISPEARGNVRRASRRGVRVDRRNDAMAEVHRIHAETMGRFGVRPKSRRFFDAIPRELRAGEDFDIWTAAVEGEVAAALLVIRFNGVSEYFASGTREGFRGYDPHAALVFAAMVHETRRGARIWNWGGTRDGMNGVFHFKSKWGSRAGRYRYFVHVNDPSLWDAAPEELVARFPGFYVLPFASLRPRVA